jgi:hypothetical protein
VLHVEANPNQACYWWEPEAMIEKNARGKTAGWRATLKTKYPELSRHWLA